MKKTVLLFLLSTCALSLAACSNTRPILNVEQAPVTADVEAEEVRQVIITAASNRGWAVSDSGNNELAAILHVRSHQAQVRIPYSAENYSIIYEDSVNLKQRGNQIHRNYNRWINNLDSDIRRQLNLLQLQD